MCRVFKKRTPTTMRRMGGHESPCWYDDQVSMMSELDSPQQASQSSSMLNYSSYACKKEFSHHLPFQIPQDHLVHLPLFENSRMLIASPQGTSNYNNAGLLPYGLDMGLHSSNATMQQTENNFNPNATILLGSNNNNNDQDALDDQVTDWRVLDKFVASQLSQEDVAKGNNNNNSNNNNDNNNSSNSNNNNNNNNNSHNNNYLSSGVGSGILFPAAPISDHLNKEDPLPDNSSTPSSSSQIDVWK